MRTISALLVFLLTAAFGTHALSQSGGGNLADALKQATVDMPIGTSPASFLLGGTGESVPRLTSFREFSALAARAVDETGKVSTSIAAELTPAYAIGGGLTWEQIKRSQLVRLWSRTTISIATKESTGNLGARSALGLQTILWAPAMEEAKLTAYDKECEKADKLLRAHLDAQKGGEPGKPQPLPAAVLTAIEDCQKLIDGVLTKWNQPMVAAGGGRVYASSGPNPANDKDSAAFWITAAYGGDFKSLKDAEIDSTLRTGYLLTAHVRENRHFPVTNVAGVEVLARQRLYGLNGRFGTAKLAGIVEYSIADYRAAGSSFTDRKRSAAGIEYKFKKDLYLTIGVAKDSGAPQSKQSVLGRLHWGFGEKPILMK